MMIKKRDEARVKSNYLRRRRVAQAAADVARGLKDQEQDHEHDTERRGMPSEAPASRRRRV